MQRYVAAMLCLLLLGCGPQVAHVVMNADNNSGQSGIATVAAKGSGIHVELTIGPDPTDGTPQAAHIHSGRCGELGAVEYSLSSVGPTPSDATHFWSATDLQSISFKAVTNGAHCINVHSHSDNFLYVSCGNID